MSRSFDAELRFDKHIHHIAHQASLRVSALRRVAGFLDKCGLMTLYKAQPRAGRGAEVTHQSAPEDHHCQNFTNVKCVHRSSSFHARPVYPTSEGGCSQVARNITNAHETYIIIQMRLLR
ncbi:hypothetical protein Pcinc_015366 [Petrolisthes cinctipes]|uniref:Uncharacterized protein n=1 Tax=Petrolisthes cinctipes TaxID=88211 RepID=A0AAE1FYF8_PETCI|nr:hypothetical protein Pcinc_015366 [Petrolisthes cinctipes]